MSREDFIAVASRLFALYLLFINIRGIPVAFQMMKFEDGTTWAIVYGVLLVGLLLFTAFLWFFPLTLGRKLLPVMREPQSNAALDSSAALSVGITLIGLWFLASAISDSSYWLTLLYRATREDAELFQWSPEQIAQMVATGAELVVALGLLLGSSGIKRLVYRLRYGSLDAN